MNLLRGLFSARAGVLSLLLITTVMVLFVLPFAVDAGLAEDKILAQKAHEDRVERMKNYHAPGGTHEQHQDSEHKGHHGHGGEHMNQIDNETLHQYHDNHHHDQGTLPVHHRMPMGVQGFTEHDRPDKHQKGDHHNPGEVGRRHIPHGDRYDFGIDVHTGKKRIKLKDIKEHVWNKSDPDHPHAYHRASRSKRRRQFKDHPMAKYHHMEDESRSLAHDHADALRAGNTELAEELAHKKKDIDRELRHLEMMHHGMSEEEYQEFKGWQDELEELNKVDSHGLELEDKKKHRDRMLELGRNIMETKNHFEYVSQPHVHPHASLDENIKMHKLFEAIHKTHDKQERAALKKELADLKEELRSQDQHRIYSEDDMEQIRALRKEMEELHEDDHLGRDKLRSQIQEIYLSYEKAEKAALGHEPGEYAHDHYMKHGREDHIENRDKPEDEFMNDPEMKELHEELHHVESSDWEEKKRIDARIRHRMHELQNDGTWRHDHIKGLLHGPADLEKHHEENHGHDPPREPEAPPDRQVKPILIT